MTTKAFVTILLLTLLLGGVSGFFIHKSYFVSVPAAVTEQQINKQEILKQDSMQRNTNALRDSLKSEIKKLNEMDR